MPSYLSIRNQFLFFSGKMHLTLPLSNFFVRLNLNWNWKSVVSEFAVTCSITHSQCVTKSHPQVCTWQLKSCRWCKIPQIQHHIARAPLLRSQAPNAPTAYLTFSVPKSINLCIYSIKITKCCFGPYKPIHVSGPPFTGTLPCKNENYMLCIL